MGWLLALGRNLYRRLDKTDPVTLARRLAIVRLVFGAVMLLAPRLAGNASLKRRHTPDEAALLLRFGGVRDVAVGAAALLAAPKSRDLLRAFTQVGAACDATDAVLLATGSTLRASTRVLGAASAGGSAAAGFHAAGRLH